MPLVRERTRALGARAGRDAPPAPLAVRGYYAVRPLLPRGAQLRAAACLRPAPATRPSRSRAWPVEHSLHDMYDWLLGLLADVAGEPVPVDRTRGRTARPWALVLTHDVETDARLSRHGAAARPTSGRRGYRSSWNFVPGAVRRRPTRCVERLRDEGCEVGVHGLRHDGRDLALAHGCSRSGCPAIRAARRRAGARSGSGPRPPSARGS